MHYRSNHSIPWPDLSAQLTIGFAEPTKPLMHFEMTLHPFDNSMNHFRLSYRIFKSLSVPMRYLN